MKTVILNFPTILTLCEVQLQLEIKVRSAIVEDVKSCCQVCIEFLSNSIDSTARFGANTTEHASQMELCIMLAN